ncbi:MAG: hypothetical protein RLZZ381_1490 [Cyanobacteriota bacterium]|jgi:hypothetical protein
MLQIQQLTATSSEHITCEEQQQIHGGDTSPTSSGFNPMYTVPEELLWQGYANGSNDLQDNGEDISFVNKKSGKVFEVDRETGKSKSKSW